MKLAAEVEFLGLPLGYPSLKASLTMRLGSPEVGSLPSASKVLFSGAKAPSQGSFP